MKTTIYIYGLLVLYSLMFSGCSEKNNENIEVEICIYGATPSGITAAIAASQEGKKVIIVEQSQWAGGILGAGLKPIQDSPNFEAVGGLTRELLLTLGMRGNQINTSEDSVRKAINTYMSPKDVLSDFNALLKKHKIDIVYNHRISNVHKEGSNIKYITFDLVQSDSTGCPEPEPIKIADLKVTAKMFIDATYEGDLMATANVSFRTGRESISEFNESLAGVRNPIHTIPIDPYVIPGDKSSGLLPLVVADHKKTYGSADENTQAYNFRYYITDDPKQRSEIKPPKSYNPKQFELVGRYVDYIVKTKPKDSINILLSDIFPGWRNSNDYNYQRESLITMAPLGISQEYAEGDFSDKSRIWKYHQDYLSGLYTFLCNDSRVPKDFRETTAELGFDKRHFPQTNGWPHQLYVRISRRLKAEYTITQSDIYNKQHISDPIALAQYGIDTYPSRRYLLEKDGKEFVAVEGNMFVGLGLGPTKIPYQISFKAIVPKLQECNNLLVPVCFSATHVGYASARMEPVFMIVGESAGIAASQAIDEGSNIQDIDMDKFEEKLLSRNQRLTWPIRH